MNEPLPGQCVYCGFVQQDHEFEQWCPLKAGNTYTPAEPVSTPTQQGAPTTATMRELVMRHYRHVQQSPGVGVERQTYAQDVLDDVLRDLDALSFEKFGGPPSSGDDSSKSTKNSKRGQSDGL